MLQSKFYHKFFPISKINDLRLQITNFKQKERERFTDSLEKFKELTMKCPPHGFKNETIVQYFYRGLTSSERNSLKTMKSREFLSLTGDESYKTLDGMSERAQQWDFQNSWDRQHPAPKIGGLYEVKNDGDIREEIKVLKRQFDTMALNKLVNAVDTYQAVVCGSYDSPMHFTQNCPTLSTEYPTEEVNAFNEYRKPTNGLFSKTYNLGWRNHPNFSLK
jgi:hypothetical protein